VLFKDFGQRFNDLFDPFVRRQQAKGKQDRFSLHTKSGLALSIRRFKSEPETIWQSVILFEAKGKSPHNSDPRNAFIKEWARQLSGSWSDQILNDLTGVRDFSDTF
jgi:hypothetical protein